ncbi:hypothetical protein RUM43_006099 [Polyplax serrata]|uniref:Lipase n=1 Tax=Polyplax serrata TaxID=468196 RepID=A0AAN8PKM9_POLSC
MKSNDERQIIRSSGFPSESHTITTPDGYIAEIHRIPHGRRGPSSRKEHLSPVLFQHGILCSSASHLLIGPNDSLPFLLADAGYDVWLGNSRGNTYSRAHVTLEPNEYKFWNYTWHEAALHGVSAEIDFVLETTNKKKLVYIGHSMGTTMFFVLMSTRPEYNRKIEVGMLMAPVAYLKHTKSPLFRLFAPLGNALFNLAMRLGVGEVLAGSKLIKLIEDYFCEHSDVDRAVCGNIIHIITGDDPNAYDKEYLDLLLHHFPEGYSVKAFNHYVQLINCGKFRMYDYGKKGNMKEYGLPAPPNYDLKKITAPMFFYAGKSDYLADMTDVNKLTKEVKSLKSMYLVENNKFGHLDFLIGCKVKELLYNKMIQDLTRHLKNSTGLIA